MTATCSKQLQYASPEIFVTETIDDLFRISTDTADYFDQIGEWI